MATTGMEQSLTSLPASTGSGRAAQSSVDVPDEAPSTVLCLTVLLVKIKCRWFFSSLKFPTDGSVPACEEVEEGALFSQKLPFSQFGFTPLETV